MNDFQAAPLSSVTLRRLRALEDDLSEETGQSIILVAYTNDQESASPSREGDEQTHA